MQLSLPSREAKPRKLGLSLCIDNGVPLQLFRDYVESYGPFIDFVKFGWGTSCVTPTLSQKIEILNQHQIDYLFGGTLFEKFHLQGKFEDFLRYCESHKCQWVEISNGTIDMANSTKAAIIEKTTSHFNVLSEVGYKDAEKSQMLAPAKWIEYIRQDLAAGAKYVIAESREGGNSGTCRANGEIRHGLIEEILESGISSDKMIFEAPNKSLQSYFIKRIGGNVNLGNISFPELISLETLRLGLRSETFFSFEN